jgi:hypothetical protein
MEVLILGKTDLTRTDSFPGKEIALFEDKSLLLVPSVLKPAMSRIDSVPTQSNGSLGLATNTPRNPAATRRTGTGVFSDSQVGLRAES